MEFNSWIRHQDDLSPQLRRNLDNPEIRSAAEAFVTGVPLHYFEKYRVPGDTRIFPETRSELFSWVQNFQDYMKRRTEFIEVIKKEDPEISEENLLKILQPLRTLEFLVSEIRNFKKSKRSKASKAGELGIGSAFEAFTKKELSENFSAFLDRLASEKELPREEVEGLLSSLLRQDLHERRETFQEALDLLHAKGTLKTQAPEQSPDNPRYKNLVGVEEAIASLARKEHGSRYLNIRRAQNLGEVKLGLGGPIDEIRTSFRTALAQNFDPSIFEDADFSAFFEKCLEDLFQQFVLPDLEKKVHQELRSECEERPLRIVETNFRKVLMTAPLGRIPVMGICSAGKKTYRLAVVDREGVVLQTAFVNLSDSTKSAENDGVFLALIEKSGVQAIAIGTHMGGREVERHLNELFRSVKLRIPTIPVSNEGSDAYAASPVAEEEFPALDPGSRKAVFLARQLQNPLAELVKVKPRSLGVGQYLNEISQERLNETLTRIMKECVHEVGVDLNSASVYLLSLVDGLSHEQAKSIVEFRQQKGFFWDRDQILEVPGIDQSTFEYCGSFLRIRDGKNPLDITRAHPKFNKAVVNAAKRLKFEVNELNAKADLLATDERLKTEIGPDALNEIIQILKTTEKDPRGEFQALQFREDLRDIKDLKPGLIAPGRISNVTPFGAFVDLGLSQDGLVHLSELSHEFIRDPFEIVQPGDLVTVKVMAVDFDKKQISLSMKGVEGISQKNQELVRRKVEHDREREKERDRDREARENERRERAQHRDKNRPNGNGAFRTKTRGPENGQRGGDRPDRDRDRGPRGPRRDSGKGRPRPTGGASKQELTHNAFADLAKLLKK